jgi:hypothetical protein
MSEENEIVFEDEIAGELSEDDPIERAVFIALDEAATKLDEQGEFDPFVIIVQGDELQIEEQSGDDEDMIIEEVKRTIFQMERVADAYIFFFFCFVELDDGTSDAIIAEYARKDGGEAQVLAWLYETHEDHVDFLEPLYSLGNTQSFFSSAQVEVEAVSDEAATGDAATGDAATVDAVADAAGILEDSAIE